jgi:hypothetical protein
MALYRMILNQGTHMITWPVIAVTLLMLVPVLAFGISMNGWAQHFKTEGNTEY